MANEKGSSQVVRKSPTRNEYNSRVTYGSSLYGDRNRKEVKKSIANKNGFTYDPILTTHIIRRDVDGIKDALDLTSQFHKSNPGLTALSQEKLDAVKSLYEKDRGDIMSRPLLLAIRMCSSKTLEMTRNNEKTGYNVIHVLAENFDTLVAHAKQKGHPTPSLKVVMSFVGKLLRDAKNPDSNIDEFKVNNAVLTLINGLSDENKARIAEIITPQKEAVTSLAPAAA